MTLVIVGGGNAGLAAAVTAGELGVPTVVLEKTERLGGQLHWSSGHFSGAASRLQRSRGIDDTWQEHMADVIRLGNGRGSRHLIELAAREAGATIDWLESLGFPFSSDSPALVSGHELYGKARTYWGGEDPRTGGRPILETLLQSLRTHASVQVHTDAKVEGLRLQGARVTGVILDDGTEFGAQHTLLATGGYAASRTMVAQLQPDHADALTGCLPHATGDGHRLLADLDVDVVATDTYVPTMGMIPDPNRPGFGIPLHEARYIVNATQRAPWEIWVDDTGRRFVDEATPSPFVREQALMNNPGLAMSAVWDERIFRASSPVIGPDWTHEDMLDEAQKGSWLWRVETLRDLADALGVDGVGLEETARAWNDGAEPFGRQHRPLPIAQPPFWGVRCVGGMLLSRGGPRVDDHLRPVRSDGSVLDGVSCVGELLGMGQFSGDNFAGGMSVGPALSLARWVVLRHFGGAAG